MSKIEFKEGSVREVWKTSYPIILSMLSGVTMLFFDRLFLAKYSLQAMNSTVVSGLLAWSAMAGFQVLCEMSEVFVAQYNGAKRYKEIGNTIWQMLWLSLASLVVFIPMGLFLGQYIFPDTPFGNMQNDFYSCMVFVGPVGGLFGATAAFFIGQGRGTIVTIVAVLGNIVNVILDPLFIFGWGPIPSMGVFGAALATAIGFSLQGIILFVLFLSSYNRKEFDTGNYRFDMNILRRCVRLGMPTAIFLVLELISWSAFYSMMGHASETHMIVANICQSVLILFLFFGMGLQKGVSTVGGNLIGAQRQDKLIKLMKSGLTLVLVFFFFSTIPMILFPEFLLDWFLQNPQMMEGQGEVGALQVDTIKEYAKAGLFITCFYLLFENIRWVASGLLSAAGDTFFLMASGITVIWVFMLIPAYILIMHYHVEVHIALSVWLFYSICAAIITYFRYFRGRWKDKAMLIN